MTTQSHVPVATQSREAAAAILLSIQGTQDALTVKSDAKDTGDEAFEMADELIAMGDWAGARGQINLAEEKWGVAGLLGLTGMPFEAALDSLRGRIPGDVPAPTQPPPQPASVGEAFPMGIAIARSIVNSNTPPANAAAPVGEVIPIDTAIAWSTTDT